MTTIHHDFEVMEPGVLEGSEVIEQIDPNVPLELRQFEPEVDSGTQIIHVEMMGTVVAETKTIIIGSLLDDRLRMTGDVKIELEREAEHYIANFEGVQEFGYGLSPLEAVDDLRKSLSELYWSLNEDDEIGSDLKNVRDILNRLIEPL